MSKRVKVNSIKASVTVFMSLIMLSMILLISTLREVITIENMKSDSRMRNGNAIYATFGEYHKGLQNYFGILALDGSYMSTTYDVENVLERFQYYGGSKEVDIQSLQLLTDIDGSVLLEQIVYYMEEKTGVGFLEDLVGSETS